MFEIGMNVKNFPFFNFLKFLLSNLSRLKFTLLCIYLPGEVQVGGLVSRRGSLKSRTLYAVKIPLA